jgi:hypothetical protein
MPPSPLVFDHHPDEAAPCLIQLGIQMDTGVDRFRYTDPFPV